MNVRRALTCSIGALAIGLGFPVVASAAGGSQLGTVTTPGEWYTVANNIGQSYGLAPDGNGGLLSYSYVSDSASPLYDFSGAQLTQAAFSQPVQPLPAPLTTTGATSGQWDAGIAVSSGGTIYFTNSSDANIYTYDPATSTTATLPLETPWNTLSGLVLSPDGQYLYVSDQVTGDVYRVDLATHAITTVLTTSGDDLQQMVFDGSGDLFVVDQSSNQVDEIPASTLASTLASPATVGNGAQVVIDWGAGGSNGLTGLAIDAAGNLYSGDYSSNAGYPSIVMVTAAQLAQVETIGIPASFVNGELIDVADSSTPAVNGPQPLTVVNNTLYVGNYSGNNIVAVALADLSLSHPQSLVATRTGSTLSLTWSGGQAPYRCVLLLGYHDPTGFAQNTSTTSCTFTGLSLFIPYGVQVITGYGTPFANSSVAFAPAPGLTCARGSATRHYTVAGSVCPRGWHATT